MGIDNDEFVHPERISKELMCCICTQVLDNPVQTPSEHLFCEDELLEWLSRSTLCPATNTPLDPSSIRRPSRIILNMLAELQRFCPNRAEGCPWVGENEHCSSHAASCSFRPRAQILAELQRAEDKVARLKEKLAKAERRAEQLSAANDELRAAAEIRERKLRVYTAFLDVESGSSSSGSGRAGADPDADADAGTDPDPHQLLPQTGASAKPMSAAERAVREQTVMEKLARLRALHGSLAEIALEEREGRAATLTGQSKGGGGGGSGGGGGGGREEKSSSSHK